MSSGALVFELEARDLCTAALSSQPSIPMRLRCKVALVGEPSHSAPLLRSDLAMFRGCHGGQDSLVCHVRVTRRQRV